MGENNIVDDAGITAGGDVSIKDNTGQIAIGKYINQFKIEKATGEELFKLINLLDQKREEAFNKEILNEYTPSELSEYPPRLKEFVTHNRADELTKALIYLQDHRILLISGIGGVGKTTLARALIETRPANVPLPFWFDFGKITDATLGDVLERLARYMKAPTIARFKEEKKEAGQDDINRLIGELQKREQIWLIFDNLETMLDENMKFCDLDMDLLFTSLRGTTHNAKIIVTSRILPLLRNEKSLIDIVYEEKQDLKGLKINFAVDYLIKNGLDGVEHKKLEELAVGVDGHPLALKLLIELVKKSGISDTLNDLSIYQERKEDTIKKARRLFDKLAGDEKELLERISVFRQPESRTAIKKMFTDKTSKDAVEKLIDKSLLETDHKGKYWLHPLVREFAYDNLENKIKVHELACKYYLSLTLPEKRTKKEDVQPLIEAHYHACMSKDYDKAADIIFEHDLHKDLDRLGNYRTLIELYNRVLPKDSLRDKPLLRDIKTSNRVIGNLANTYYSLGDAKKALEYYEKALKNAQEIVAQIKRYEGRWFGGLGTAYYAFGDIEKAIEHYEKALKIAQEFGDKENECRLLGNIGNDYRLLGDAGKAIEYLEKSLMIAQEIGDRKNEGIGFEDLGNVHCDLGNVKKAIEYYEKAIKIAQEIGDRKNEGIGFGDLGNAYCALGNVKKATGHYETALLIAQEIGDKRNEGMWLTYSGNALCASGDFKRAIECYEKALKIAQKIEDKRSENIYLGKLGSAYLNLGEFKIATEHFKNALEIAEELKDKRHEGIWLGKLGSAYLSLGEFKIAIEHFKNALEIADGIGDIRHKGLWLGNLGNAYYALNDIKKAIEHYEHALKIAQEIEDQRHKGLWLNHLGIAFMNEEEYKEALACYFLAKDILSQIENPEIKRTEANLNNLKEALGKERYEKLTAEVAPRAEEIVRKILEESSEKSGG